jgi:hypothetical protein
MMMMMMRKRRRKRRTMPMVKRPRNGLRDRSARCLPTAARQGRLQHHRYYYYYHY